MLTLPRVLCRWYYAIYPTRPKHWMKSSPASHKEKSLTVWMPWGRGEQPSDLASGLAEGTQCTYMHTQCIPISSWPVSKKSSSCSAQGTRELLFICVYRNSCKRKTWVYNSVKYTCWLSCPNATVLLMKERESKGSILMQLFICTGWNWMSFLWSPY